MIFDQAAANAAESKIQHSIANLLRRQLEERLQCECLASHVVVNVGGNWRAGEFRVTDVTSCCLGSLDRANTLLASRRENPSGFSSFTHSAIRSRDKARRMFSLR